MKEVILSVLDYLGIQIGILISSFFGSVLQIHNLKEFSLKKASFIIFVGVTMSVYTTPILIDIFNFNADGWKTFFGWLFGCIGINVSKGLLLFGEAFAENPKKTITGQTHTLLKFVI